MSFIKKIIVVKLLIILLSNFTLATFLCKSCSDKCDALGGTYCVATGECFAQINTIVFSGAEACQLCDQTFPGATAWLPSTRTDSCTQNNPLLTISSSNTWTNTACGANCPDIACSLSVHNSDGTFQTNKAENDCIGGVSNKRKVICQVPIRGCPEVPVDVGGDATTENSCQAAVDASRGSSLVRGSVRHCSMTNKCYFRLKSRSRNINNVDKRCKRVLPTATIWNPPIMDPTLFQASSCLGFLSDKDLQIWIPPFSGVTSSTLPCTFAEVWSCTGAFPRKSLCTKANRNKIVCEFTPP